MAYTTYAIGDVHGRADLLAPLLEAIAQDAEASGVEPRVLFLGDIVDRGPSSRHALDLVCDTLERWPRSRLIRGNHDAYFLDFMTADAVDHARSDNWLLRLGGYATMESYGLLSAGSPGGLISVYASWFYCDFGAAERLSQIAYLLWIAFLAPAPWCRRAT